jgi:hypothetical protein
MWRIEAKHETVCPRCRGYIKLGAWIVQDQVYGTKWSHAVCPRDLRQRDREEPLAAAPTTEWYTVKIGDDNNVIALEEV